MINMKNLLISKIVITAFLVLATTFASAQSLAERRALKEYQDNQFEGLKSELLTAAGYDLILNVDWEKLAIPGQAANYSNEGFFTNIYFRPLILAIEEVAFDEMGQEALRESLTEVHITYDSSSAPASAYQNGLTFDNGVLSINFTPWSNTNHIEERKVAIVKVLEENL